MIIKFINRRKKFFNESDLIENSFFHTSLNVHEPYSYCSEVCKFFEKQISPSCKIRYSLDATSLFYKLSISIWDHILNIKIIKLNLFDNQYLYCKENVIFIWKNSYHRPNFYYELK